MSLKAGGFFLCGVFKWAHVVQVYILYADQQGPASINAHDINFEAIDVKQNLIIEKMSRDVHDKYRVVTAYRQTRHLTVPHAYRDRSV